MSYYKYTWPADSARFSWHSANLTSFPRLSHEKGLSPANALECGGVRIWTLPAEKLWLWGDPDCAESALFNSSVLKMEFIHAADTLGADRIHVKGPRNR